MIRRMVFRFCRRSCVAFLAAWIIVGVFSGFAYADPWEGWAGNSLRQSIVSDVPQVNHREYWNVTLNNVLPESWTDGKSWSAVGAGSPIVSDNSVYVYAKSGLGFSATDGAVFALDRNTGAYLWGADISAPQSGSWTSPMLDTNSNSIVIGSGSSTFHSIDAATGIVKWTTPLVKSVVNATAAVGGGRAYITDYNGFGTDGILYGINLTNGAIDWQYTIGGASGATPAYHDGAVYVGSINDGSGGSGWPNARGQVYSIDAASGAKNWQVALPDDSSAGNPFGGLSYYDGNLYLGTYEFYGDDESAGLYKIDATGTYENDNDRVVMSALANRSDAIPVIWERADGKKILIHSGGIEGFGTHQELQFFDEETGVLLGKTSIEDNEGWVGNWVYQPVVVNDILYVGGREAEFFGPSNHLFAIDLSLIDWASPFTLTSIDPAVLADLGHGSSPAYFTDGEFGFLYTYGAGGEIAAYGGAPVPGPMTAALLLPGLLAIGFIRRCKKCVTEGGV